MKIFSGSSNPFLAEKIAKRLGLTLSPLEVHVFPDGERRVRVETDVLDEDVVVIQSTATPVDQNYMELFFLIDAMKRNGARSLTLVMSYFGYERQDHIFRSGEAVSLEVVAAILEGLGVDKVIGLDAHTIKLPSQFTIPFEELTVLPIFADYIRDIGCEDAVLVSPDMGGLRRVKMISSFLEGMPYVATVKERDLSSGAIQMKKIEGDLQNAKKAFIVDDMISSGKTVVESAQLLLSNGVLDVFAFATHPIFSEDAPVFLQHSPVKKVFVTDSVFVPEHKHFQKLSIISVSALLASVL